MKIDRRALKRAAREQMAQTRPSPIAVTLIYLLITYAVTTAVSMGMGVATGFAGNLVYFYMENPMFLMMYFFLNILATLFGTVMNFGYSDYTLRATDGEKTGSSDLFSGFPITGRIILMSLVVFGFTMVWAMAVLIPSGSIMTVLLLVFSLINETLAITVVMIVYVIAAFVLMFLVVRYALSTLVLADNPDIGALNAVRRSRELLRGRSWEYFVLQLSFFGWFLLAVLIMVLVMGGAAVISYLVTDQVGLGEFWALVAGVVAFVAMLPLNIWLTPYMMTTNALYFRALSPRVQTAEEPVVNAPWRV